MRRCCPPAAAAEYNWAEQAPKQARHARAGDDGGLPRLATGGVVDYILEKPPLAVTPKDTRRRCLAKDAWNFCNDYYAFFLSPLHAASS